ncbi:MAG: hypothetical protein LBM63_01475 [Rikenellaceae bacterium]|jgi:hypothetical protein|nr:hypothetical protein [Rikenellaceae bacterium]
MKKIVYIVACGAVVASFAACKNQKHATPVATVKENVEIIKVPNFDNFVDAIAFEEPVKMRPVATAAKSAATRSYTVEVPRIVYTPATKAEQKPANVIIVPEVVAPAEVTNNTMVAYTPDTYEFEASPFERFDEEYPAIASVLDTINYGKDWKIRNGKYKEVWRAVDADGNREVLKFREGHDRDFVKVKAAGERDIVKNLEFGNRFVDKIKMDGDREICIDRITPYGEVVKVVENGKVTKAVKTRDTQHKASLKEKFDGEKEFVKVLDKRDGQDEVIKTLSDGERNREVIKDLAEHNRTIHKVKRDGERVVEKIRNETSADVFKVKQTLAGETYKIKEIVER